MSHHDPLIRVWSDSKLKAQLLSDPRSTLVALSVPVPDGVQVRIVGSKGSPGDEDDPSLIQFILERDTTFSSFFLPSPRSPCAQQAAYGLILSRVVDDPALEHRVRLDADRALSRLDDTGVLPTVADASPTGAS